jgi:TatD DNase family protein
MEFIDTHAHLFDDRFAKDLMAVVTRANDAGVLAILTLGIDRETSAVSVHQAERFPSVYAAVGIQPNHVAEAEPGDWDAVEKLAAHPRVVVLGETGLDRYWDRAPFEMQEDYFRRHLELSHRLGKPVAIHCRDAERDVVRVLQEHAKTVGTIAGIMHSYCGDLDSAKACLALGLHVSFAGMMTYKTADNLRAMAREIPLDRLLIETDCPYLAPVPLRGKRNEPAFVIHTAQCLADARGQSLAEIAAATTANARRLLRLV